MTFDAPKRRLATNMEPLRGSVRGGALPPVGRFAPNRGLPRWNPYGVAAAQHGPCTKNAPFSSSSTLPVRPPAQHEPLWGSIFPPPTSLSLPHRTLHEPQRGSIFPPPACLPIPRHAQHEPRRGSMLVAPGCPAGATGGHANKNLSNPVGVPYSPPPASLSLPRRTLHEPQRGSRPSQVFLSLATSINEPRRGFILVAPGCPAGATGGHGNKNLSNPVGVPYSPPRPLPPFPPLF